MLLVEELGFGQMQPAADCVPPLHVSESVPPEVATEQLPLQVMLHVPLVQVMAELAPTDAVQSFPPHVTWQLGPQVPLHDASFAQSI